MKRLIALSVLLVFGSVAYADYEMSDSQKQKYRDWLRSLDTFYTGALAIAPNGCWYADGGGTRSQAKRAALKSCKKHCKSDACKVVDVNGTSAFIKQRGSSSSSSTASTSTHYVWCATDVSVSKLYESSCRSRNGKGFSTKTQAQAEHQRLKKTTTASTVETLQIWGGTYIGEVVNGRPNGQGTWVHPNGNKYVGEWKDGKRWNGTYYDKNGKISYREMNGKRQ